MKIRKKSILKVLLGLSAGGAGNALFLYIGIQFSSPEQKTFLLSTWSGIFLAGAFLSAFETHRIITIVKTKSKTEAGSVISASLFLFLMLGFSQMLKWKLAFLDLFLFLGIGGLTGLIINARANAAALRKFDRLATASALDGVLRIGSLLLLALLGFENSATLILFCYFAGSLGSVLALKKNISVSRTTSVKELFVKKVDLNMVVTGGLSAMITGGLPVIATFLKTQDSNLTEIISVFTFSRMFLILQTLITYIDPEFIDRIGKPQFNRYQLIKNTQIFIFFILVCSILYFTGLFTQDGATIRELQSYIFIGSGIGLGTIFNLTVTNLLTNLRDRLAAISSIIAAGIAFSSMIFIADPGQSFITALNLSPACALIFIYALSINRTSLR